MVLNKTSIYIVAGAIVVVSVISTYLITSSSRNKEYNKEIKNLEKERNEALDRVKKREVLLDSTARIRFEQDTKIDSLNTVIIKSQKRQIQLDKDLKKIKGMYKKFSDDSLYKELIKQYEASTGDTTSFNK